MAKHWWFKFDFRVWRNDSDLQQCSLEARGFWLEMLCVMYEQDTFQVSGSVQQIARLARCDSGEVVRISLELKNANVCDVTLGNGSVTLLSRRLKRNVTDREQTRLRVQKYRGNGDVTAQSKKKEVISKKKEEEGGSGEPQNRATRSRGQTQDEWLSVIKSNPIYAHIDIDRELGKSQVWIDDHPGRKLTKQFFLNWINKIDPPLREIFLGKVEAALASRMGIKTLPNRHDWHQRLLWAFTNDFTPEAVIETYDLMKKGFWANKSVSAKSLVDNIPNLEALRAEVASKNGHRPVDDLPDGEMLYAN